MLSNGDVRRLHEIGVQLEREDPRLARRLCRFDRERVLVRLWVAVLAVCTGVAFAVAGFGPGTTLFGLAVIAVSGWETGRRVGQLRR